MKQTPNRHKLGDFMEGKGFYIVLFLCVAAIGISGYYLFSGLFQQSGGFGQEVISSVSGQADLEDKASTQTPPDPAPAEKDQDTAQVKPDPKPAEKDTTPAATPQKPQGTPAEEPEAKPSSFVWPVDGNVERDFSLEVFAYDATMGDWRTHSGLDIGAELGAPVNACAGGQVTEVTTDDMMGVTVRVDHGRGMESVYSNLAESVNVKAGDQVEAGDLLGTVGTSAISESASPSHLHFELVEYGVSIDPLHYLEQE